AFLHAGDLVAKRSNFSAKLVPWNEWRMNAVLRPTVPVVDVKIGAADGSDFDLHQDVGPSETRDLYLTHIRAGRRFWLDHRQHCCSHNCHLTLMPEFALTQNV